MRKFHTYTEEQIDYLKLIAKGKPRKDVYVLFREKYPGAKVSDRSIQGIMYRNEIKTGHYHSDTQFKKGNVPWSKGIKGLSLSPKTQFKKGDAINSRQLGHRTFSTDRNRWIEKTGNPNKWVMVHHLLWEREHGKIPKGHYVLFKDENPNNLTLDNLFLTTIGARTSVARQNKITGKKDLNIAHHKLAELNITVRKFQTYENGELLENP